MIVSFLMKYFKCNLCVKSLGSDQNPGTDGNNLFFIVSESGFDYCDEQKD